MITLKNDVWAQDVVSNSVKLNALTKGIVAETPEVWSQVIAALDSSNVFRTSDTVLTINLPPVINYAVDSDQTINVSIPATTMSTSAVFISAGSFAVKAVTATLSGTAVTAPLDSKSVISGGETIVITLSNATWASDVTSVSRLNDLLTQFSSEDNWNINKSKIIASIYL